MTDHKDPEIDISQPKGSDVWSVLTAHTKRLQKLGIQIEQNQAREWKELFELTERVLSALCANRAVADHKLTEPLLNQILQAQTLEDLSYGFEKLTEHVAEIADVRAKEKIPGAAAQSRANSLDKSSRTNPSVETSGSDCNPKNERMHLRL